jgi:hypothetical protein
MSNVSFGTNISATKKRVKFYNRSSSAVTIYEGMPVCYMFDTLNNVLGWDKGNSVEGTTTAEAYQNEGKFLIVELPYTDNLLWFAGVVAYPYGGKSVAATSYEWVDIYEANGAIVPVRAGIECTTGVTVLAVVPDLQYLSNPVYDWDTAIASRPVAVAEETNATLDTTNGIVLAKLDPNMFLYQGMGHDVWCGTNTKELLVGKGATSGTVLGGSSSLKGLQTGGDFCAKRETATLGGAGSCFAQGAFYYNAIIAASPGANWHMGTRCDFTIKGTGLTLPTGKYAAGMFKIENQETTPSTVTAANLHSMILEVAAYTSTPNQLSYIYVNNSGDKAINAIVCSDAAAGIQMTSTSTVTLSHKVPLFSVGGVVYYVGVGTVTG